MAGRAAGPQMFVVFSAGSVTEYMTGSVKNQRIGIYAVFPDPPRCFQAAVWEGDRLLPVFTGELQSNLAFYSELLHICPSLLFLILLFPNHQS